MTFAPKSATPLLTLSEGAAIPHEKGEVPLPPSVMLSKRSFSLDAMGERSRGGGWEMEGS